MSGGARFVFFFGNGASEGDPARVDLLGGKGASLAAMSRAGFPVPPGFTISAECCALAEANGGRWPDGLEDEVRAAMARLERATGRRFGSPTPVARVLDPCASGAHPSVGRPSDTSAPRAASRSRHDDDGSPGNRDIVCDGRVKDPSYESTDGSPRHPLLVAVRSGAGVSMPGMMDTILNCGLTPAHAAASPRLWHDLAEHVRMFAASVAGLKLDELPAVRGSASSGSGTPGSGRQDVKIGDDTCRTQESVPANFDILTTRPLSAAPAQDIDADTDRRQALAWIAAYERHTSRPFPADPWESLRQCVDAVFASWHSERARAYRAHHDVRGLPGTAVNVQSMFPSERSGVLFTVNPQQPDADEMILEASYGLGEAVVSGAVTPDIYVIDRETLTVKRTTPGHGGTTLRVVSDVPSTHDSIAADGKAPVGRVFDPSADSTDSRACHQVQERPTDGSSSLDGRVEDPSYGVSDVPSTGESTAAASSAPHPAQHADQPDHALSHDARRGASCHTLCLTEAQVREIAELGMRVEQHFGVPSDIEWGIADGKVALLQTRAIRGLDVLRAAEELRRSEAERLKILAGDRHIVWAAHNLGETLPHPTPLTWSIVRWFMSGDGGFGRLYRLLGFRPSDEVCRNGFLELVAGRIYVDPTRAARLFWGDMPFEYDASEILADPQTLERPPTKLDFAQADPFLFLKLPGLLWSMGRSSRAMRRMRARATAEGRCVIPARDRFHQQALPELERFLVSCAAIDLQSASFDTLLVELDRRVDFVLGDFAAESLLPGFFAGIALEELQRWLAQIFGAERGEDVCRRLTAGLDGDVTIEQNQRLYDAANETFVVPPSGGPSVPSTSDRATAEIVDDVPRARRPHSGGITNQDGPRVPSTNEASSGSVGTVLDGRVGDPSYVVSSISSAFLRDFGHRAAEEMELAQPRWREDSSFLERMMAGLRRPSERDGSATSPAATAAAASPIVSPAARHAEQARARHEAEAALPALLKEYGASSLREKLEPLIAEAQALLPFRETGKYHLMRGYETIRAALVEMARRFDFGRDLFFLERDELRELPARAAELKSLAARRKTQWQAAKKLFVPDIVDSKNLDDFGQPPPRPQNADGHFAARPIAGGVARGPARIVLSPSEAGDLGNGYILVCPSTDPGWTPLFLYCKGLVVERGGTLSHGAIVARDFGIPAVVLENATRIIPDGSTIEIDATAGVVILAR